MNQQALVMPKDSEFEGDFEPKEVVQLYNSTRLPGLEAKMVQIIRDLLKERGKLTSCCTLLDVGCGHGGYAVAFSKHFDHVIGVEPSILQIEGLKKVNKLQNLEFKVGKGENLPVADGQADVIVAVFSLHFMEVGLFVKECRRVLKVDGIAFFYNHVLSAIKSTERDDLPVIVEQVEEAIRDCHVIAVKQSHPERHVLEQNQSLFESIKWPNKSQVETQVDVETSLHHLSDCFRRLPFYARLGNEDPMRQLLRSVKRNWSMEDRDDKDIKIRVTYDAKIIVLVKNSNTQ